MGFLLIFINRVHEFYSFYCIFVLYMREQRLYTTGIMQFPPYFYLFLFCVIQTRKLFI